MSGTICKHMESLVIREIQIHTTMRYNYKPIWSEVKWSEVTQSCPSLCGTMDCSLPGFSIHGIFQARVLEWGAISFSRGPSWPRDRTRVSRIAGRRFTLWATREAPQTDLLYCHPKDWLYQALVRICKVDISICSIVGNVMWYNYFGKQLNIFLKN